MPPAATWCWRRSGAANSSAKFAEIQLGSMRKSGGEKIVLNVFGLDATGGNLVTPENPVYPDEFHAISDAAREMQTVPFYIDQTGGISIAQLAARARRLKS